MVRVISVESFARHVRRHDLEGRLIGLALHRFRESEELRLELAAVPARERVLRALLRLAVPMSPHGTRVEIGLDQTEFGQSIGLGRTAVANQLAALRKLGLIETRRGRIVVKDLSRLRDLSQA